MWSKTGQWKPQDYSLHYSYNNISERPTDEEIGTVIPNSLVIWISAALSACSLNITVGEPSKRIRIV